MRGGRTAVMLAKQMLRLHIVTILAPLLIH